MLPYLYAGLYGTAQYAEAGGGTPHGAPVSQGFEVDTVVVHVALCMLTHCLWFRVESASLRRVAEKGLRFIFRTAASYDIQKTSPHAKT